MATNGVTFKETAHRLLFVDSAEHLIRPQCSRLGERCSCLSAENNIGVKVTTTVEGGNMVQLSLSKNKEGVVYYGANLNAFPLKR
jgi:hypothetical protein